MPWHARLNLALSREGARTVVRHEHEGPLRVLQTLYPEGDAISHTVLVHPPSGLVAGDTLEIALQAAAQGAFESGDTPLSRTMFDLVLRAGARLDARNQQGQDALLVLLGARSQPGSHCDAEHLHQLAAFLLERGARVDTQDQRGVGALHACALHGLSGCARLLKAHGAPLDLVDGFERSAADVASLLGYVDVAAELDGARAALMPGVRQTLRRPARAPD